MQDVYIFVCLSQQRKSGALHLLISVLEQEGLNAEELPLNFVAIQQNVLLFLMCLKFSLLLKWKYKCRFVELSGRRSYRGWTVIQHLTFHLSEHSSAIFQVNISCLLKTCKHAFSQLTNYFWGLLTLLYICFVFTVKVCEWPAADAPKIWMEFQSQNSQQL